MIDRKARRWPAKLRFSNSVRPQLLLHSLLAKTTRDERRWGRTRRALILREWRDSPSQAEFREIFNLAFY